MYTGDYERSEGEAAAQAKGSRCRQVSYYRVNIIYRVNYYLHCKLLFTGPKAAAAGRSLLPL